MIGQIRLQWWREAWEGIAAGRPRQHPVVLALHSHCRQADPADVAALIDARERDMEPAPMISEEHTSELQSLMRISYAVFCLHKKKKNNTGAAHTDDTTHI